MYYYCVLIKLLVYLHARHECSINTVLVLCSLFFRLCETHSVTIYGGGTAIDPILNSLCGFRDRENINYSGGNKLLVEFRYNTTTITYLIYVKNFRSRFPVIPLGVNILLSVVAKQKVFKQR